MIKIRYSKERLKNNLRLGIVFISIGITLVLLSFATGDWKSVSLYSIGIGQMGAGVCTLIIYYFENQKQYLTLKSGELIKNQLIPKKIKLSKIKSIREFAGELKLIMGESEFIINTQIIEPKSLAELKKELNLD